MELDELTLERDSLTGGLATYRTRVARLREKGLETLTDPVSHLLQVYIEPVDRGLVQWIMESRKKPGRRAVAIPILSEVPGEVSAMLALKVILDSITKVRRLQSVAIRIGKAIEDEMRFTAFEEQNKPLYDRIQKHIDESPNGYREDYRKNVLTYSMNKYKILWEPWSEDLKVHVGAAMIDLIVRYTGLIRLERVRGRRRHDDSIVVEPDKELLDWIDQQHTRCEVLQPPSLPMVAEPLPYTVLRDGGYYISGMRRPIVRAREAIRPEYSAEKMPVVFKAVNTLQAVPWAVNSKVLDVVLQLWESGHEIPKAAGRVDLPLPPKPHDIETNPTSRARYKAEAREVGKENMSNRGRRLATAQTLSIARRFNGQPIYFPTNLDFRGRMYTVPQYLSPQGSDLGRGLLTFHRGVPLGKTGMRWLLIHAANCFGVDKVSLDEREEWAVDHLPEIRDVASDPFANKLWHEADSPVQFLAACFEIAAMQQVANREEFVSTLPIMVDGSCNGIQHLAALSRDAEAGVQVNLVPAKKPSDIYGRVAQELREALMLNVDPLAQEWLSYGVDRSICKRPTMILPYGGTRSACEKYIDDELKERARKGNPHPFGTNRKRAVRFLATVMWEAMGRVVQGPRATMKWTKVVSSIAYKANTAITWRTPSGFLVRHAYPLLTPRRVETRVGGVIYKLTLAKSNDQLDPRRQAQALAPNWIHSLDAAALHLTIVKLVDRGVADIAAIHDSYGTHAGNMDAMASTLREEFVAMYQGDPLGAFIADVEAVTGKKLPDPPPRGTLDISGVLDSAYFFA